MNGQDELRELWGSQPSAPRTNGEELMRMVEAKTKMFDRKVRNRNLREIIASVIAMAVLGWTLVGSHDPWKLAGGAIIELALVVIIYTLLRYGTAGPELDPSGSVSEYTLGLLARFDRQIRLLKAAKYWYLLPMYVGLMVMTAGPVLAGARTAALGARLIAALAGFTVFFGFVWWLNEVYAVGKLRKGRARVEAMLRGEDVGGSVC
jgi:hypothetical protein